MRGGLKRVRGGGETQTGEGGGGRLNGGRGGDGDSNG